MGSLNKEPPGHVTAVDELMAIAHALEQEASDQYHRLAERMRGEGERALATLFESLSRIEAKHTEKIDSKAMAVIGKKPDSALVRWELPENFDEDEARTYLLTPYRALAMAVRNEERAFAFYTYIAAYAEDDRVRQLAEECAKDELEHAALLRRERRKAWRSEREAPQWIIRRIPRAQSLADVLADVATAEHVAAVAHHSLSATLATAGDTRAARMFEEAAAEEQATAEDAQNRIDQIGAATQPFPRLHTTREGLRLLEESFEHYSDLAERVSDESALTECQSLAERALRRLSYVQGSIGNALITNPKIIRRLAEGEKAILSGETAESLRQDRPDLPKS